MSVTSLTGTTWTINSSPSYSPFTNSSPIKQTNIYADFESDGTQYTYISILDVNSLMIYYVAELTVSAYSSSSGWSSENKRTITFLGEPYNGGHAYDATAEQVIEWLEANAVQVVPDVDVDVSLGNTSIASLSNTGSVTLATQNTYLTDDITINYTKSGGIVPSGTISIASNGTYDVASYASAEVNVSGGGEDTVVPFIENYGTMTSFAHSSITKIGQGAFALCSSLTTVSLPSCTSVGSYAFYSCTRLTTASFPQCTSIGYYAFLSCASLTTASFPQCTIIGGGAFSNCTRLTTASFPQCTSIGSSAFAYCSRLTTASFPSCTIIGSSAFYYCYKLTTVSFPSCTNIISYAFAYCSSLTTASFPSCTSIGGYAFSRCYKLVSLYLTGSSIASLTNSNAFTSTPIAGYTTSTGGVYGSIFVPSSLYSSYKTATNWTYFSSRFVSV